MKFPSRFDDKHQPAMEDLHEVETMLSERVKEWNNNPPETVAHSRYGRDDFKTEPTWQEEH